MIIAIKMEKTVWEMSGRVKTFNANTKARVALHPKVKPLSPVLNVNNVLLYFINLKFGVYIRTDKP